MDHAWESGFRRIVQPTPTLRTSRSRSSTSAATPSELIAAVITWRGQDQDKALKWVLLREGSLGLAAPLVYIPAMSFRSHGGARAFGFTAFLPPGGPINEPSLARGLAAELTATDLDLIRPDVDRGLGWICGYHCAEDDEDFPEWCREARRHGYILAASGEKDLPVTGPDCASRAFQVLMESVVAAVPLAPASTVLPDSDLLCGPAPTEGHTERGNHTALFRRIRRRSA